MSRYIDADALLKGYEDHELISTHLIWNAPTADVVEVVRCKDCIRNADNGGLYDDGRTKCPIQEHYALLKDGFCHLGERKEQEHDV